MKKKYFINCIYCICLWTVLVLMAVPAFPGQYLRKRALQDGHGIPDPARAVNEAQTALAYPPADGVHSENNPQQVSARKSSPEAHLHEAGSPGFR